MEEIRPPLWSRAAVLAPTLLLLAAAIHVPTLGAYVFADDVQWIMGGRSFRPLQLFELGWRNHFFRPVVELYFALAARTVGDAPATLHALNVGLHAVNAILVWRLALALNAAPIAAALAAILFAAHTRAVPSVAWISGVTAVLSTTFLVAALVAHLAARRTGRAVWRVAVVACFGAALLTHESCVVLLPLLLGAEWTADPAGFRLRGRPTGDWVQHGAAVAVLIAYAAAAVTVNQRNYVVTEGHYRLGTHAFWNLLRYLDALYVGRADGAALLATGAGYAAALLAPSPRIRFGIAATVLTLVPCSFFTWGETMRYLYLPAVFFSLALAEGLVRLAAWAGRGRWRTPALALAGILAVVLVARFAVFGAKAARDSRRSTERYREYVAAFQARYGAPAPGATIVLPPPRKGEPDDIYIEPLLQMAFDDSSLRVHYVR